MEPKLTVDLGYWVIGTAVWAVGGTNLQLSCLPYAHGPLSLYLSGPPSLPSLNMGQLQKHKSRRGPSKYLWVLGTRFEERRWRLICQWG